MFDSFDEKWLNIKINDKVIHRLIIAAIIPHFLAYLAVFNSLQSVLVFLDATHLTKLRDLLLPHLHPNIYYLNVKPAAYCIHYEQAHEAQTAQRRFLFACINCVQPKSLYMYI